MNKDELNYSRICKGKIYSYSVCEDGKVIKTSLKYLKESKVKPFLKNDRAMVKINGKEYCLKILVAKHFLKLTDNENVIIIDGNPFNCHVKNLRIETKTETGKRTGHMSGFSKPVLIDGVKYQSVRKAAKALFCSYQTLNDYLNGKVMKSVVTENNVNKIKYLT